MRVPDTWKGMGRREESCEKGGQVSLSDVSVGFSIIGALFLVSCVADLRISSVGPRKCKLLGGRLSSDSISWYRFCFVVWLRRLINCCSEHTPWESFSVVIMRNCDVTVRAGFCCCQATSKDCGGLGLMSRLRPKMTCRDVFGAFR